MLKYVVLTVMCGIAAVSLLSDKAERAASSVGNIYATENYLE